MLAKYHNKNKFGQFQRNQFSNLIIASTLCTISILFFTAFDYAPQVNTLLIDASKLYEEGKFGSAKLQFEKALDLEPNCTAAYNGLGLCALKERDLETSSKFYKKALETDPDYYDAVYNLANNLYLQQEYTESIAYYLRALRIRENEKLGQDAELLCSIATVYRDRANTLNGKSKQDDLNKALKLYQSAIQIQPDLAQAHSMLGKLYFDLGNYGFAEKEFKKAIELKPKYSYCYYMLAKLYLHKKEFPAALISLHNSFRYETVSSYKEDTRKLMASLGLSNTIIDNFAEAYEALAANDLTRASCEFEAATVQESDDKAVAFNNLAFCQFNENKTELAIQNYKKAIELNQQNIPEIFYNLAIIYLEKKDYVQAEKLLKQAINLAHGNYSLAHNVLGIVLKKRGNTEDALKHYNIALMQSAGSLAVVEFNRGILLEKMGKIKEAKQSFQNYLSSSPQGLNADIAKKHINKLN